MTPQRRVILEALRNVTSHPTADGLYEMVRRQLPRISLGTVYRNLEVLSDRGIIQKLALGGAQKHFDGDARNHYHIRCTGCGRVDDVPIEAMAELEEAARGASDYEITGHCVGFIGLCPECKKRGASSSGKNDSK
jgi:Fur family ferric uptake transcriptional regulator